MKTLFRATAFVAVLVASVAANAAASTGYNFSYTFNDDKKTLSGSFSGTATGDLINNIANVAAIYNGIELKFDYIQDPDSGSNPIVSISGAGNSFVFYSENQLDFIYATQMAIAAGTNGYYSLDEDLLKNSWHVTPTVAPVAAVAAVPEPETYATLLVGLGLMAFAARRCKFALTKTDKA